MAGLQRLSYLQVPAFQQMSLSLVSVRVVFFCSVTFYEQHLYLLTCIHPFSCYTCVTVSSSATGHSTVMVNYGKEVEKRLFRSEILCQGEKLGYNISPLFCVFLCPLSPTSFPGQNRTSAISFCHGCLHRLQDKSKQVTKQENN